MKRLSRVIALAAMAGSLSVGGGALAEEAAATGTDASASTNALRVVRDEATGELRAPNAEELKALIAAEQAARAARVSARARSTQAAITDVMPAEKSVVRHANGMVSVRLGQESLTAIKAQPAEDGKVRIVHGHEEAAATSRVEK